MELAGPGADWEDAETYAPLLGADRSIFAWEWLRRDPGYRSAAEAARARASHGEADASPWGLHRFEDPDLAAPVARPVWRASHHNLVVAARAAPAMSAAEAVDLMECAGLVLSMGGRGQGEAWLFSDGLRAVRLDLEAGTGTCGPVELHFRLFGRAALQGPLLTLRRLVALIETGRFSRTLHPFEAKARRWVLALRANDALVAGASQRDIASELLRAEVGGTRWRVEAASVRSQAQRLVRAVRGFTNGGWACFL